MHQLEEGMKSLFSPLGKWSCSLAGASEEEEALVGIWSVIKHSESIARAAIGSCGTAAADADGFLGSLKMRGHLLSQCIASSPSSSSLEQYIDDTRETRQQLLALGPHRRRPLNDAAAAAAAAAGTWSMQHAESGLHCLGSCIHP